MFVYTGSLLTFFDIKSCHSSSLEKKYNLTICEWVWRVWMGDLQVVYLDFLFYILCMLVGCYTTNMGLM